MGPFSRHTRLLQGVLLLLALLVAACSDRDEQYAGPTAPEVQAAAVPGSPGFDQELGAAFAAHASFTDEVMGRPGVVGTAVGLGTSGRPALVVLVEDASVSVPGSFGGLGVRPLVTGTIYALQESPPGQEASANAKGGGKGGPGGDSVDPSARFPRPVPIGVSTGHPDITAGTIGARVVRGSQVLALSNSHVYANAGAATIGDPVIQPGSYDGGVSPADDIGTLFAFAPINFGGGTTNVIDAAIALSSTAMLGNGTVPGGYGTPRATTVAASLNMSVQKCGRTTGCTSGRVYAYNATVDVNYGSAGVARFVNQIIITPGSFSAGGDSGSLIVARGSGRNTADDRKPVGLLFAGSSSVTIANPIGAVLDHFGVTIDGN